jgi:hypothetical protein
MSNSLPCAPGDGLNDRVQNGQQPISELIYSNVQTTYGGTLGNWLNYADANTYNRESAFHHVAVPTYYTGNSQSSEPAEYYVQGYLGTAATTDSTILQDITGYLSDSNNSLNQPFGTTGNALYFAYADKFREVNVTLTTPANGGSYILQYPTAVDAQGNPTTWANLPLISDGTSNGTYSLAQPGRITFDPPSNWVTAEFPASPASVYMGAQYRLYYLRFYTQTQACTQPVASSIRGRDFTGAGTTETGVVPAFDYSADTNHDGYLSDSEYYSANRNPADTARFVYEGRFVGGYAEMRFPMNVTDPGFTAWAIQFHENVLSNTVTNPNGDATGIFMDNSNGLPPTGPGQVVETIGSFDTDYAALVNKIDRALQAQNSSWWILPNTSLAATATGSTLNDALEVIKATQASYDEFMIRATTLPGISFSGLFDNTSMADFLNVIIQVSATGPFDVIDSDAPKSGSPASEDNTAQTSSWQLATLAAYYMVSDSTRTLLDFDGGAQPGSPWVSSQGPPPVYNHFSGAAAFNIGQPTGAATLHGPYTHTDNGINFDSYYYERDFLNGSITTKVLYQPISQEHSSPYSDGALGGDTNTVSLGGSYQILNADGSLVRR